MTRILIVEDDKLAALALKDWLESEKYIVDVCYAGEEGWQFWTTFHYDLVILDWELPDVTGIELLQRFRTKRSNQLVIMLTGRTQLQDKERGLDEGADDYLTKPFQNRELSARVRALLRRPRETLSTKLCHAGLELDSKTRVVSRDGRPIRLLPKEYALLEFFMMHPNQLFSADDLLNRVWPSDSDATITAVRTYMTRLRQKIKDDNEHPLIRTQYAGGYIFEP